MYKHYCKKIDATFMEWGCYIPKEYIKDFLAGKTLRLGESRDVNIKWDNREYPVKLYYKNKRGQPYHWIDWANNRELLNKIRKTFIQSYIAIKSQKEKFWHNKKAKKQYRTNLLAGQQEVIIFTPKNSKQIEAKTFIRIENEWNHLFQRLAEANVSGWIFDKKNRDYLIQKSTNWIKAKDFNKHKDNANVIYYLAHTKRKLLYIGKAQILGKRVMLGRKHQNMPEDWDLFKYDIVRPEFSNILERIEDHTIRSFASILKNTQNYNSLQIGGYTLVNSNWKKL